MGKIVSSLEAIGRLASDDHFLCTIEVKKWTIGSVKTGLFLVNTAIHPLHSALFRVRPDAKAKIKSHLQTFSIIS